MPNELTPDTLTVVIDALLTWAIVGVYRWRFPKQWDQLDSRKVRLVVVGITAVVVAVITGLFAGLGWVGILKAALGALAGAVLARQSTKGESSAIELPNYSRPSSIRTKPPSL